MCPLVFASVAAPAALLAGQAGQRDAANIYVMIGTPRLEGVREIIASSYLREIGPERAPFARMIYADPVTHTQLIRRGFWIIPASTLAALCGLSDDTWRT